MKKNFTYLIGILTLISFTSNTLFSQNIEEFPGKMPKFPGVEGALNKYLSDNIKYPQQAAKKRIEGKVIADFVVDTLGNISNPRIIWGISPDLDKEALRLIMAMPNWVPGEVNGEKVKVKYTLPINFRLPNSKQKEIEREFPVFNEGKDNLFTYLNDNLIYPQEALREKVQETAFVQFIVDKNGKVKKVNLLTSTNHKSLDEEAIRLIENMPLWRPAKANGEKTDVRYVVPVYFKLP